VSEAGKGRWKILLIKKILLPVDFSATSASVLQQAVTLAERFHAELVMLHVVTPESHAAGVPTEERSLANWNLLTEILQRADNRFEHSLRTKLKTLVVRCELVQGDPARAIVHATRAEEVDLIMMSSYGYTFNEFLLGSVTMRVLRRKECPVWTGSHTEELSAKEFSIQNILCAVGSGPRSQEAASWAAQVAAEFGAHLTLSKVTESAAIMAPGGTWANPKWQQALVHDASQSLAELQKNLPVKADLLVGSGDVPKVLSQIAKKTKADLLVLDCYPYSGNLRMHAYATICTVSIPVLSV
jgi:nucleotide-binding universal stress UspA family protein